MLLLVLVHRFLGHCWSGEVSEHASLILPQSTRMHNGKTNSWFQGSFVLVFLLKKQIKNLMAATSLKSWGRATFTAVLHPSFVQRRFINIWELKRPVAGPLQEECFPIHVWYRILAARQSLVLFVAFCFLWCLYLDSPTMKPCCCNRYSLGFSSGLVYNICLPWKRHRLGHLVL